MIPGLLDPLLTAVEDTCSVKLHGRTSGLDGNDRVDLYNMLVLSMSYIMAVTGV